MAGGMMRDPDSLVNRDCHEPLHAATAARLVFEIEAGTGGLAWPASVQSAPFAQRCLLRQFNAKRHSVGLPPRES